MTTPAPETLAGRRVVLWPVVFGVLLFPVLQYGIALRSGNPLLALAAAAIAYLLCICLYRGVMSVTYSQGSKRLLIAAFGATIVAGLVAADDQILMGLANSGMIPLAAIMSGRSLVSDGRLLRAYLIGTGVVVVGGLIMYLPEWGRLMAGFRMIGEENMASSHQSLIAWAIILTRLQHMLISFSASGKHRLG